MVKNILLVILLVMILSCDNNPIDKVKMFGTKEFVSSEWKKSNASAKSKMIYSFLKSNDIKNMNSSGLYQLLGESTAYYEYDEFPAYKIVFNGKQYIIAFPLNRLTNKVRQYIFKPRLK